MESPGRHPISANFAFLATHEEGLVLLAGQAEVLFAIDPVASIAKLRAADLAGLDPAVLASAFRGKLLDRQSDPPPVVYEETL